MMHSCPDGTYTRLVRTGPTGTMIGVTFTCPRCGWASAATVILDKAEAVLNNPAIRAILRRS